jgi:hypothetical protein
VSAGEAEVFTTDSFLTHDWGLDELGRKNHDRIGAINAGLQQRAVRTWCDTMHTNMTGNILDQVTAGINSARTVCVCLTRSYVDKVESNSFNVCQLEFNHAVRKRLGSMVVVIMEPRMRGILSGSYGGGGGAVGKFMRSLSG